MPTRSPRRKKSPPAALPRGIVRPIKSLSDGRDAVLANAAQRNGLKNAIINAAALSTREQLRAFDKVLQPSVAPLDQESTGLCWAFSGLNVLRYNLARRMKLADTFCLSQTHVLFHHKLESANAFMRKYYHICKHEPHPARHLATLRRHPITDGGCWGTFVALASKYGVVPHSEMPPTDPALNTGTLNFELRVLLRQAGVRLCAAADDAAMEAIVADVMARVRRLLVLCLGEPPTSFTWRYETADGAVKALPDMTPHECFRRANAGLGAETFVTLAHLPGQPEGTYNVRYLDSVYTADPRCTNRFLGVADFAIFREAVDATLALGVAVFFACEYDQMRDRKTSLLHHELVDHELLIGEAQWSKAKRIAASIPEVDHAMIIDGRQTDGSSYRIQNSHGMDNSDDFESEGKGFLAMTSEWMQAHVFTVSCPMSAVEQAFRKHRGAAGARAAREEWSAPSPRHRLDPWHFLGNVLRTVP